MPYCATSVTIKIDIAPVAAEIIPGLPPNIDISTAIQNDACIPTIGSTPAMIEKAIASGMSANATVTPARTSPLTLKNQVDRSLLSNVVLSLCYLI